MFMQYLRVSAVLVLHICRVWSFICSFSLSRPCEASHKLSERGSTLLFYGVNKPQEPGAID